MQNDDNNTGEDYHISFFNPTTELAQFNKKLIIILFSIWAISIFGFQILLRVIEKPTPEVAYVQYDKVWDAVKSGQASVAQNQVFIQSSLSVLGKVTLAQEDRFFLDNAVKHLTLQLVPAQEKEAFVNQINQFKALSFGDDNYAKLKKELGDRTAQYIGVTDYSLAAKLVPLELKVAEKSSVDIAQIERIMPKYLIHNQSVLTDFRFLGFPFHYFYTAVFLLILFVALCLYYCIATDKKMLELGLED
ncbi:MAG: hypothetical protein B7C24_00815 [Bacteroidetes bacterium 4572_77]|nr:MAG: hypothetical protein B7C24_00815 [Bacteroidetes bacterium 4572_77]